VFICHLEISQALDFFAPIRAQGIKQIWETQIFLATIAYCFQKTLLVTKRL